MAACGEYGIPVREGMHGRVCHRLFAVEEGERMRVGLMTREYPPYVYGGAGVHVEYLSRELARQIEVEVHAWGDAPAVEQPPEHNEPSNTNLEVHFENP